MHALLQEKRPLKRSRLGPPDVYPQEAKQREDELTSANIKHGFITLPPLSDEFGTAHNLNINSTKVCDFINAVLAKKEELMTLQDTGRKRQQINCKDNFWPVSQRTKGALDAWFKDLAGNKPLLSLAKKAPSFNKKEDILITLCDNQVSMQRAIWFIKLSAAYTLSFSESKNKKRTIYDPAAEWTSIITKFMKELLHKLQEHYHQNPTDKTTTINSSGNVVGMTITQTQNNINTTNQTIATTNLSPTTSSIQQNSTNTNTISSNFDDCRHALKYWQYCKQLSKYMNEESLLDRQEFLNWILELIDKIRYPALLDGAVKKLILVFGLQYMQDFVQSERLCRKLAYIVSKTLPSFFATNNEQQQQPNKQSKILFTDINGYNVYCNETSNFISCPHHHDIMIYLSTILQIITIECPSALVWCGLGENRNLTTALCGSPLDNLLIPPSALPMPAKCELTNAEIRKQLYTAEAEIITRSRHAENRWFSEKWLDTHKNAYADILRILDLLDTHCFERIEQNNSIDTLYANVFTPIPQQQQQRHAHGLELKEPAARNVYNAKQDAETVKILCEWAVSQQRWGEHRAIVVAILLDKRQIDATTTTTRENNFEQHVEDMDAPANGIGLIDGLPVFQNILMDFLDNDAPVYDENLMTQNQQQQQTKFTNLVHLFSTLIRYDVFSYNAYLHTLISRGELITANTTTTSIGKAIAVTNTTTATTTATLGATASVTNKLSSPVVNAFENEFTANIDFKQNEFDDSNVDDDLDKLLQNIKEKDQQNALEAPDSPKIPEQTTTHDAINNNQQQQQTLVSRHFIYTKHFPIPQEDGTCLYNSESNQRYILLYGIGRERDEKKHAVKKLAKEICKLFTKKFSIDVGESGKLKKQARNEFNFEAAINKCQNMPYFDQHVVNYQCASTVLEQLNAFALGNTNYLPVQEHIAFLFDLMEMALNTYSLLEFCDNILKELPEIEYQLQAKKSNLMRNYTSSLALYIVGILRRYHCCLLLTSEQIKAMFEGLYKIIKHILNPSECNSAERCILAYLNELYETSFVVFENADNLEHYQQQFNVIKQFKQLVTLQPAQLQFTSHQMYNAQFLQTLFATPRAGGKVDTLWIRQIRESATNIYSFVTNALIAVCRETDNDRLNDLAISCAEITANCNALCEEWLAALQSICHANKNPRYPHLYEQIDIHNSKIHNSLAIFICILVARHCFSLADFVVNFALPTLANAYPVGGVITADAEAGARLTCQLVLKLFKSIEMPQPGLYFAGTSPHSSSNVVSEMFYVKYSCDRHLLVSAQKNIPIEAVLAILKAILIVVDKNALKAPTTLNNIGFGGSGGKGSGFNTPVHERPVDLSQILGTSDLTSLSIEQKLEVTQAATAANNCEQLALLDFAHHVLKEICAQQHVLERCLQHAEKLCDMIIDEMLTTKQVQRLLHMICYPAAEYNIIAEMDQSAMITRIFENLELWTLRISWLDLQLMYRQSINNSNELNNWLDTIARAAIDVFQMEETSNVGNTTKRTYEEKPTTWLVKPLILKLTTAVQGSILRVAAQVLENMKYFSKPNKTHSNHSCSGDDEAEKSNSCSSFTEQSKNLRLKNSPLNYKPFLDLILTCLKAQNDYKESLLQSLYTQLNQFLQTRTANDDDIAVDAQACEEMLEALQLRFSLIGGMFELIKSSSTSTIDWAILLAQLICQGVIDHNSNKELLTTVVDMLATLVHSTLISDNHAERDENKKSYMSLMKKLKKEIGEKNNKSIKIVRQFLPIYKQATEVISCEPAGVENAEKKQLRLSVKQRISVWDILEGHKNPAPLSWVWFGAVKLERKTLYYEESHKALKYHMHNLSKPKNYFFEALPLPTEDLEQNVEKISMQDDIIIKTEQQPAIVDQSPSSATVSARGRNKTAPTRKRKTKNPKTPTIETNNMTPPLTQQQQQQQQQQQHQQQAQQQQQHTQQEQLQQTLAQQQQQLNPNSNNNATPQMNSIQQMNMQANMAQFGGNPLMQQNTGQMMQQQLQQNSANLQNMNANLQPNSQMAYMSAAGANANAMTHNTPPQQPTQQPQQQWVGGPNQYHAMQQQQQQQQQQHSQQAAFYQQAGVPMNRFERPPMNNSKQALSNMLRQRQPTFNQTNATSFNAMQAQRPMNTMQTQQQLNSVQQQQQQQQYARGAAMRLMNPNQVGPAGVPASMANSIAMNQNQMMQSQNVNLQQNVNTSQTGMINSQVGAGLNTTSGMLQPNVNVNIGVVNQQAQFQGFNQQFQQQQSLNPNVNAKQTPMAFNQMNSQRNAADFLAQQQQQQQQRSAMVNNRGQFMNSAPNVTMNNMMVQGNVPPYTRQPSSSASSSVGKPGGGMLTPQQQFQQQRIHQQMMQMQNSQMNMEQQNLGGAGVIGSQQNQAVAQQQNPNLAAQLQMQMPGQGSLMAQQYQHQGPPY